jgi:uncharacterized protein
MTPDDLYQFTIAFLAFLVMLIGLVGTLVPALPGIELVWLATLGYGVFSNWGRYGPWLFALLTLIFIVGEAATWWVEKTTARRSGASWQAILLSLVLGLVGMFVIPVLGALLGAMLGVFIVEYYRRREVKDAWKATTGVLWGAGISMGMQLVIALIMFAIWGVWVVVR